MSVVPFQKVFFKIQKSLFTVKNESDMIWEELNQPSEPFTSWITGLCGKQTDHTVRSLSAPWGGQAGKLPLVGGDGHPPAFDLAQLRIRHVYLQGKLGHPDSEQQLSRQVEVGEVDCQGLPAVHFLTVYPHLVTVCGNLKGQEGKEVILLHWIMYFSILF